MKRQGSLKKTSQMVYLIFSGSLSPWFKDHRIQHENGQCRPNEGESDGTGDAKHLTVTKYRQKKHKAGAQVL